MVTIISPTCKKVNIGNPMTNVGLLELEGVVEEGYIWIFTSSVRRWRIFYCHLPQSQKHFNNYAMFSDKYDIKQVISRLFR